jgi:ABC-type multidrug transport system fused ATPase/permease subunit
MLWISAFGINSGVGALRRSVDPRIFLNIFTNIAANVSESSIKRKLSVSKTAARAELSYQYIGFMQYRVPEIIEHFIAITGAIVAMYLFDWRISVTCLFIIGPLYFISKLYNKKIGILQKEYHDGYEDMYEVFAKKDPAYVKEYYSKLALPQKKIANWGALNFGFVRISLLLIFLAVLYIAIDLDDFSAGELYSIVAYLWTYVTSTEYIPELMESWTSLKDISNRIKTEDI